VIALSDFSYRKFPALSFETTDNGHGGIGLVGAAV
jgi:hypothetical protein